MDAPLDRLPSAQPWQLGLVSLVTMFTVGTVYGLSTVGAELPRVFGLSTACVVTWIDRYGASSVAIGGAASWSAAVIGTGYSIGSLDSLAGVLAFLFVGGVGVGFTYLAVVVMVGQAFPSRPLARSAIGPLGFSSGTAACLVASSWYRFDFLDPVQLGRALSVSGGLLLLLLLGVAVVAATPVGLVRDDPHRQQPPAATRPLPQSPPERMRWKNPSARLFLSTLLFVNALPGMMVFGALMPIASFHQQGSVRDIDQANILAYAMTALALGGLLAPGSYAGSVGGVFPVSGADPCHGHTCEHSPPSQHIFRTTTAKSS
ncbi:hypothetical protein OPQ81_010402 [Rhizoctonia solani]|nr:hypothetical protein OPQ81_010402 [Rhizoctonia solani]